MRHVILSLLAIGLCSAVGTAQTPDAMQQMMAANPLSVTVRMMLTVRNMTKAAELMPAAEYGFHPTQPQMTFGKLIAHIAQTNEFVCSAIAGTAKEPPTTPTEKDSKGVLVEAVKESFDHCSVALENLTDERAHESIDTGGQKIPRVYFMVILVADWADHYSTQASYLRLNGILPLSAEPAK